MMAVLAPTSLSLSSLLIENEIPTTTTSLFVVLRTAAVCSALVSAVRHWPALVFRLVANAATLSLSYFNHLFSLERVVAFLA